MNEILSFFFFSLNMENKMNKDSDTQRMREMLNSLNELPNHNQPKLNMKEKTTNGKNVSG